MLQATSRVSQFDKKKSASISDICALVTSFFIYLIIKQTSQSSTGLIKLSVTMKQYTAIKKTTEEKVGGGG